MTPVEEAARQGYSQEEVQTYLSQKSQEAKAAGYSDQEIHQYVKENLLQQPDFNATPLKAMGQQNVATRPSPTTFIDALKTGYDWSVLGLGQEMVKAEGRLPSMQVQEGTPLWLQGTAGFANAVGDLPAIVTGGVLGGGIASPITAWAGGAALPQGIRKVFVDALEQREIGSTKDFADRATGAIWETLKGMAVGAVTGAVGKYATASTAALGPVAKWLLPTVAENAAMTEMSARLEGHAPTPESFVVNGVILGVMKGVLPSWAAKPPKILSDIYVKTGIPPEKVTNDALKDSSVWQDTLDGRIPDAYKPHVEQPPSTPTQTQRTEYLKSGKKDTTTDIRKGIARIKQSDIYQVEEHFDNIVKEQVGSTDAQATFDFLKSKMGLPDDAPIRFKYDINIKGDKGAETKYNRETGEMVMHVGVNRPSVIAHELEHVKDLLSDPENPVFNKKIAKDREFIRGHHDHPRLIDELTKELGFPEMEQPPVQAATQKAEGVKPPMLTPEQQAQAKAFLENPFAEIPQMPNEPSRPTHMNYNYMETPEDVMKAHAQLSTIYEEKIKTQQRSPESWAESNRQAGQALADVLGSDPKTAMAFVLNEQPGPTITAKILARKELSLGFTEDLMRARAGFLAKGDAATPEDLANILAKAERVAAVRAGFLGNRADLGRAMNALKSTQRQMDRSQAIIDAIESYGGEKNVTKLMKMLGEYDNPAQVGKFADKMVKATNWEMVVEAWKAGLVSGLRTHEVNFLSTAAFTTLRLPTEAIAATIGAIRNEGERVSFAEIPARIVGMAMGTRDGVKIAGAILRTGENIYGPKTDQYAPAIPGLAGEAVRIPFRFLSAEDAMLKVVNERGELYALATRQALTEGKTFGAPDFFERVVDIARNPTPDMQTQAAEAAARYTFNKPLGAGGRAFQRMVHEWHLEWMFPFIATPGNIFKETARMTPGLNFAVKEWRADYDAGGARRDRALAEVATGALLMTTVVAAASEGLITGNGTPDKRERATDRAAGWKPYAVKINGRYIDGYLRMAPIGPLMGLTADAHEFWNYMTEGERDQWARMLAFAFAQNVTNQTFMTGATNFVNVLQDPARYGENYFESLAASVVPAIIGQTSADLDPLVREIHGMRDAMAARIYWMRLGLMPRKDLFGTPIPSPEHLWPGSPFSVSAISADKVRTEASRLHFATPEIPKSIDVIPGTDFGTLDKIQLTPEQKDVFATTSGQMAYHIIKQEVEKPDWDARSPYEQRRLFEMAFKDSRMMSEQLALEQAFKTQQDEIQQKQQKALETTKRKTP